MARLDAAPPLSRALEWMDARSRQNYRDASTHAAEGRRLRAAACVGLALALNPAFSIPRLRMRVKRTATRILRHQWRRLRGLAPGSAAREDSDHPLND